MSDCPWRRVFMILGAALLLGGYGMSAASNGGLDVYSGGIDMHSNDIVDGGTTIWDASKAYVPESRLQKDALARDGSERMTGNLDMKTNKIVFDQAGGTRISVDGGTGNALVTIGKGSLCVYDGTGCPSDFKPNAGNIHALDVGSAVGLDLKSDTDGSSGGSYVWTISESDGSLEMEYGSDIHVSGDDEGLFIGDLVKGGNQGEVEVKSDGSVVLQADNDADTGGNYQCWLDESDGSWNCDGVLC